MFYYRWARRVLFEGSCSHFLFHTFILDEDTTVRARCLVLYCSARPHHLWITFSLSPSLSLSSAFASNLSLYPLLSLSLSLALSLSLSLSLPVLCFLPLPLSLSISSCPLLLLPASPSLPSLSFPLSSCLLLSTTPSLAPFLPLYLSLSPSSWPLLLLSTSPSLSLPLSFPLSSCLLLSTSPSLSLLLLCFCFLPLPLSLPLSFPLSPSLYVCFLPLPPSLSLRPPPPSLPPPVHSVMLSQPSDRQTPSVPCCSITVPVPHCSWHTHTVPSVPADLWAAAERRAGEWGGNSPTCLTLVCFWAVTNTWYFLFVPHWLSAIGPCT